MQNEVNTNGKSISAKNLKVPARKTVASVKPSIDVASLGGGLDRAVTKASGNARYRTDL